MTHNFMHFGPHGQAIVDAFSEQRAQLRGLTFCFPSHASLLHNPTNPHRSSPGKSRAGNYSDSLSETGRASPSDHAPPMRFSVKLTYYRVSGEVEIQPERNGCF